MQTDHYTNSQNTTHAAPISGRAFQLRTCRTCGEDKALHAFYRQKGCAERYRLDCIPCVREANRAASAERRANKARKADCCHKCKETLPFSAFAKDKRRRSGHRRDCKRCERRMEREREQRIKALSVLPDKLIPRHSELRERRIDLGMAIAHATCPPGECRSREEIAAYTGLTVEAVRKIEVRALWKMRQRAEKALLALGLEDIVKEGVPQ